MKCINHSHPEYGRLRPFARNLLHLDSLIDKYQTENNTDEFPPISYIETNGKVEITQTVEPVNTIDYHVSDIVPEKRIDNVYSMSNMLDKISRTSDDQYVARLAERLHMLAQKNNVNINFLDKAEIKKIDSRFPENGLGLYLNNQIYINKQAPFKDTNDLHRLILHESLHALTSSVFYKNSVDMTPKEKKFVDNMKKILANYQIYAQREYGPDVVREGREGDEKFYGFTDEREFIAEIFTNDEFVATLANLEQNYTMNILSRIIDAIVELLGLSSNRNVDVIRKYVLDFIKNDYTHYDEANVNQRKIAIKSVVDDINRINSEEGYTLTDDTKNYTDKTKTKLFDRLTSFVFNNFNNRYKGINNELSDEERTRRIAESAANRIYRDNKLETTKDITITQKDLLGNDVPQTYTFEEFVTKIQMDLETGRMYGTIAHKIIQSIVAQHNGDTTLVAELEAQIKVDAQEKIGVQNAIDLNRFDWITHDIENIFDTLGLDFLNQTKVRRDEMVSELLFVNEKFGLGTTIDGLIKHINGTYSLIDFKAGQKFTDDQNTSVLIKHAKDLYNEELDTRETKAKLELVLRAVMLKEQYPEMRFRDIKVAHLNQNADGGVKVYPADLRTYLSIIERFYRDTNPEFYSQLQAKGLFNSYSYMAASQNVVNTIINNTGLSFNELADKKQIELDEIVLGIPESKRTPWQRERITSLIKEIYDLRNGGMPLDTDDKLDMGLFKRWLGNLNDVFNPLIQRFKVQLDKANKVISDIEGKLTREHDKLYREVQNEYYDKYPSRKVLNKGVVGGLQWISKNLDGSGIFDFMWTKKTKGDTTGYYMLTLDEITKSNQLTKTQKEYATFVRKSMKEQYEQTMLRTMKVPRTIRTSDGEQKTIMETKTIASIMGYPEKLEDDFTPRMSMNLEEYNERHAGANKDTVKFYWNRYLSNFLDHQDTGQGRVNLGVPVKYMGQNNYLVSNELHSFNPDLIFKSFTSGMIKKRYKDELFVQGQAIISYLKDRGEQEFNNPDEFKSAIGFMQDHITAQVLDTKKETILTRKEIKIGDQILSADKVSRSLKQWVSSSAMWLQIPAGIANTTLITILNNKNAVVGSLAKRLKVDVEDIDFTMRDLQKAKVEVAKMFADYMTGNIEGNKLWLLAKELRYLPDNYDYKANKSTLPSAKNKALNESFLYFAHSLGEDYGQMTLLAAQLSHMKNPDGSSVYDSYSVKTTKDSRGQIVFGELEWTGGTRFKTTAGEEIKGITAEEITRLKRVSARIHGGYRNDERTALELTAFGEWALQFKKYIPSILTNMFNKYGVDTSLGRWEKFPEKVNGEDIYHWVGRVNEGRIITLMKVLLNYTRLYNNTNYDWTNLKGEQKKNLIDVGVTAMMFTTMLLLRGLMFDDDDEETQLYKRYSRLAQDITQGYHPMDMLRNFQTQQNVIPKMVETMKAANAFVVDGLIEGKTTNDGYFVGQKGVMKATPIFNSLYQWDRYLEDDRILTVR